MRRASIQTSKSICQQDAYVPVKFRSKITELGLLELSCENQPTGGRSKLEFNVREDAG